MVQKNLEDYLETKRVAFPRFYFLSNDELLEILSQTRNPQAGSWWLMVGGYLSLVNIWRLITLYYSLVQAVQPHLQKCFDGIRLLDFGEEVRSIDIHAMVSGEGERVALGKNLKARGSVEVWLTAVEGSMRSSIRALAKKGVRDYPAAERAEWVITNPAQLVIVISNIFWCQVSIILLEFNSKGLEESWKM